MIDRMFIQEEKTTLALDKQLAKEKPGERGREGEVSPTLTGAPELDSGVEGVGVASPYPPLGGARARPSCSSWSPLTYGS